MRQCRSLPPPLACKVVLRSVDAQFAIFIAAAVVSKHSENQKTSENIQYNGQLTFKQTALPQCQSRSARNAHSCAFGIQDIIY
jgi:hypothetical protein